jgi:hypothetical protein
LIDIKSNIPPKGGESAMEELDFKELTGEIELGK